jgi:hypothetical protein
MSKNIKITVSIFENTFVFGTQTAKDSKRKSWKKADIYGKRITEKTVFTDYLGAWIDSVSERIAYRALIKLYAWADSEHAEKFRRMADDIIKMHDANYELYDTDSMDIVQVVSESILRLVHLGLVNCPSDMVFYRSYVYKVVNRYAHQQARDYVQTDNMFDESDDITIMDVQPASDSFTDIINDSFVQSVSSFLMDNLSAKCNKQNVILSVVLNCFMGWSQTDIAYGLMVSIPAVNKYLKMAMKCIKENGHYFAISCLASDSDDFIRELKKNSGH